MAHRQDDLVSEQRESHRRPACVPILLAAEDVGALEAAVRDAPKTLPWGGEHCTFLHEARRMIAENAKFLAELKRFEDATARRDKPTLQARVGV